MPPEELIEHCARRLAAFEVLLYYAYVDDFPRNSSEKIAKVKLAQAMPDLRQGAFDRKDGIWRHASEAQKEK